jgi:hypothetical protein
MTAGFRPRLGGDPEGDEFYNREVEISRLLELVERDHCLLLGPRRIGKTGILKRLLEKTDDERLFIYMTCQNAKGSLELVLRDLVSEIYSELERLERARGPGGSGGARIKKRWNGFSRFKGWLGSFFSRWQVEKVDLDLKVVRAEFHHTLEGEADRALKVLSSLEDLEWPEGSRLVVMMDEFGDLIERWNGSDEELIDFLSTFQTVRKNSRLTWLRFIFAGSTSLTEAVREVDKLATRTINDLATFVVDEFTHDDAVGLLTALARYHELELDEGAVELILRKTGCFPFFIQLFMDDLQVICDRERVAQVDRILAARAYEQLLSSSRAGYHLTWFRDRLEHYGDLGSTVIDLLSDIARKGSLTKSRGIRTTVMKHEPPEIEIGDLLSRLKDDYYLVEEEGGRYRFRNEYFRDWWTRMYL